MDQFIVNNAWGIVIGGAGLALNAGIIYATVKASLHSIELTQATHNSRLNSHGDRLSDIEKRQAERLGYERAVREMKEGGGS